LLRPAWGIALLLAAYFALFDSRLRVPLAIWARRSPVRILLLASCLALPYLAYSLPMHTFSTGGLLALLLFISLPVLVLMPRGAGGESCLADIAALLLVWLPLELKILPGLWPWPPGQPGHYLDGVLGTVLAVFCFQIVRPLPGIGLTLASRKKDWLLAGLGVLAFLPPALGLGLWTGLLKVSAHAPSIPAAMARILGIFLITAIPEELLFRGLVQNLLLHWTGRPGLSLFLASILFGVAHLNVGSHPDWRLAVLATLAGVMYGSVYRAGGSLMAPALAHTLVNSLWTLAFRR
jgi:membrane protease YdiL (CAAX protease family)